MGLLSSLESSFGTQGHPFKNVAAALVVIWIVNFIWTFYKTRKFYRNLPGPPHSWLLGHLPALARASQRFPPDMHPQIIVSSLVDEYPELRDAGVMYLDTFPIRNDNQMVITRGAIASQVTVFHVMRKHPVLKNLFGRIIGLKALAILEGQQWKEYRGMFNTGFAASNIISLMPAMLEEGEVFVKRLSAVASAGEDMGGYAPSILQLLKDLTADIIMRLTMGTSTHCQEQPNQLIEMICAASRWPQPASINPLEKFDFTVDIAVRYYDWRCKRLIKTMVLERWEEIKSGNRKAPGPREAKVMLDLALFKYHAQLLEAGESVGEMDPEFLDMMCDNVKGFVFGGQDTTANSVSWVLYAISQNPHIMAEIRREHDSVFGPDPNAVGDVLRAEPHLINELPLTTAVIKEGFRFFAPTSSTRSSDDSMVIQDPVTGRILPSKNQLIFMPTHIYQRDATLFPHPDEFLPSRFLPNNEDTQNIDTDAFRPFEKGPRSCIGQDLAMTEMKLILALVIRRFTFKEAYVELNRRRGTVPVSAEKVGGFAYPVLFTTAQPKDGMPMWVKEEVYES